MPPKVRFLICPLEEAHGHRFCTFWPLARLGPEDKGNLNYDSGIDLPFPKEVHIEPGRVVQAGLGVKMACFRLYHAPGAFEPPVGIRSAFSLVPRSSISRPKSAGKPQRSLAMLNSPGLIDVGYNGELCVRLCNLGSEAVVIPAGEALVQAVSPDLAPPEYTKIAIGDELFQGVFAESGRGAGGFGSTGAAGTS